MEVEVVVVETTTTITTTIMINGHRLPLRLDIPHNGPQVAARHHAGPLAVARGGGLLQAVNGHHLHYQAVLGVHLLLRSGAKVPLHGAVAPAEAAAAVVAARFPALK